MFDLTDYIARFLWSSKLWMLLHLIARYHKHLSLTFWLEMENWGGFYVDFPHFSGLVCSDSDKGGKHGFDDFFLLATEARSLFNVFFTPKTSAPLQKDFPAHKTQRWTRRRNYMIHIEDTHENSKVHLPLFVSGLIKRNERKWYVSRWRQRRKKCNDSIVHLRLRHIKNHQNILMHEIT